MTHLLKIKNVAGFLALFLIAGAIPEFAQRSRPVLRHRAVARRRAVVRPVAPLYTVVSGTTIRARMNGTLSSRTARIGDTFTATVTEPVYSTNGVVVIPVGSTVTGRVDTVRPAAKGGIPGQIGVGFTSVRLPNGRRHAINGSLTDLMGSTRSDNESTATGKTMNNRKLIFIGGGGVGGTILGAAVGGGKGALIGGILGAGGGFLGEKYTKGKEAEVQSGTEFGVYLNQAFSLPKFAEAAPLNP